MPTILKIPFDKCIVEKERRGAAEAPDIIQKEYGNLPDAPRVTWHQVKEIDDFKKMHLEIENSAKNVYKKKDFLIGLGGDHSVSYSLVKAFFETHKNAGLIVFDAHLDCVHNFYPPTHEDWLRVLVEEKIVPKGRIFHFGSRNNTKEEISFAINNLNWDSTAVKLEAVKEHIKEELLGEVDNIYLSIDIDILDPEYAPGTGWPEAGGITYAEMLDLVKTVKDSNKLRAADIVEVSPLKDKNSITAKLAAQILAEILSPMPRKPIV